MTGRSSLDSGSRRSTVAISGQDTSVFLIGLSVGRTLQHAQHRSGSFSAALVDFFVDQTIRLNPRHHAAQTLTDVFDGVL